jgi:hypothetical protein
MNAARAAILAAVLGVAAACSTSRSDPAAERRAFVQVTKETALADLDAARPDLRARLDAAPGWAVFSTVGARVLVGESGGGFGVARDTKSGAETYMRMSEPDGGDGLRPEEFRAVLVFRDEKAFREFVDKGWDFGTGAAAPAFDVFQLRDGDLVKAPVLAGTRFWKDRSLN